MIPKVQSEVSNENFDHFEEEDQNQDANAKNRKSRKIDMNFIGYTYKAGVEAEKSMLVNVLKELDNVNDQQFDPES